MGLDMYLNRHTHISTYRRSEDITINVPGVNQDKVKEIVEEAGYWRKANAIHAWFVKNVQDGIDDCGTYEVSEEDLLALRELCQKVIDSSELVDGKVSTGYSFGPNGREDHLVDGRIIKNSAVAEALLPVQEGFFFGSYEYNEYYLNNIKETIEIIDNALELSKDIEVGYSWFTYGSSW